MEAVPMDDPLRFGTQPADMSIVGRERENSTLCAMFDQSQQGHGRLVLIGGEAGIGKTTLVVALARYAREQGALVLSGGCYDLAVTPPYGPWIELATRAPAGHNALPISDMLGGGGAIESQGALFEHVAQTVAEAAGVQPLTLILEDMHWSDQASLELLRSLNRRLATLPVLVLATYRTDELTRRHPLFQTLPLLAREADASRIDLRRLDGEDVRQLLSLRYALPPGEEERLAVTLTRQTDGNPFFLSEMLRALEDHRVLTRRDGSSSLGSMGRMPVPELVRQVIDNCLARLSQQAQTALACAAVIGQQAELDLWQSVAGLSDDTLLDIVEQAVEARFVESTPDGARVRFVHALIREALYESILPTRRRVWHVSVADHLLAGRSSDPDRIAHHLQQAGDARATDWLVRAGERAQRAYALRMAGERFDAAAQLMEGDDTRRGERGWLLYRIGRLMRYTDAEQGMRYLEEAGHLARAVNDPVLEAFALADRGAQRCMAADIRQGLIDLEAGVAALDDVYSSHGAQLSADIANWVADALPSIQPAPRQDDDATATPVNVVTRRGTLVLWFARAGRNREAIAIGEPFAAQMAQMTSAHDGYADAMHGLAIAYAATGRSADAREAFASARAAYHTFDHYLPLAISHVDEVLEVSLPYDADQPSVRRQLVAAAEDVWSRVSGADKQAELIKLRTLDCGLLDGDWHVTRELAQSAADQGAVLSYWLTGPALGRLARDQGDTAHAWETAYDALPAGPSSEPGGIDILLDLASQRLAVDLALDAQDLPLAQAWLDSHDRWLNWSGSVRGLADAALLRSRLTLASGNVATARQLAERLFLARRTVNTHLTSIYTKLNVSSRTAAARFAVEHGLT